MAACQVSVLQNVHTYGIGVCFGLGALLPWEEVMDGYLTEGKLKVIMHLRTVQTVCCFKALYASPCISAHVVEHMHVLTLDSFQ